MRAVTKNAEPERARVLMIKVLKRASEKRESKNNRELRASQEQEPLIHGSSITVHSFFNLSIFKKKNKTTLG